MQQETRATHHDAVKTVEFVLEREMFTVAGVDILFMELSVNLRIVSRYNNQLMASTLSNVKIASIRNPLSLSKVAPNLVTFLGFLNVFTRKCNEIVQRFQLLVKLLKIGLILYLFHNLML